MTKNLGRALPPLIWTKSKRTATFFVKLSLILSKFLKLVNKTQFVCPKGNRERMNRVKIFFAPAILLSMLCNFVHLRAMRTVQLSAVCSHVMCNFFCNLQPSYIVQVWALRAMCCVQQLYYVQLYKRCFVKPRQSAVHHHQEIMCTKHLHQIIVFIFIVIHKD